MDPADRDVRPTIPIGQVDQLLLGARRRGLDPVPLLVGAGIAPTLLASPLAQVTQTQFAALARGLRRRLRDELWGLCAHPLPPGSYAQGLRAMVRCATLGDALALAVGHYRLLLHDLTPRLRVQGEVATLSFTPHAGDTPDEAMDYALRTLAFIGHGTACWLVGRWLPLQAVNMPHRRLSPGHTRRLFQAPVDRETGQAGFRALRDALRRDCAIEYLAQPGLSLAEIAHRMGFSEVSTFHRAFRHWTGLAPGQYRLTRRG